MQRKSYAREVFDSSGEFPGGRQGTRKNKQQTTNNKAELQFGSTVEVHALSGL
jgi:hypothetical protein